MIYINARNHLLLIKYDFIIPKINFFVKAFNLKTYFFLKAKTYKSEIT